MRACDSGRCVEKLTLNIRANIDENQDKLPIATCELDWNEALPAAVLEFNPDVILMADITVFASDVPAIVTLICELLSQFPRAVVLMGCYTQREVC